MKRATMAHADGPHAGHDILDKDTPLPKDGLKKLSDSSLAKL
jgi:hypothetical protein